jgi:hypothetical protein
MKIVAPSTEAEVKFSDLAQGDVFRGEHGHVFMRTRNAATIDAYKTPLNAVDLETGGMKGFPAYDKVVHLKNARLVLGEQE